MNKKWIALLALSGTLNLAQSMAAPGEIPMIGLDENGKPAEVKLSLEQYSSQLRQSMASVQDSTASVLNRTELRSSSQKWLLRVVTVGALVSAQLGFGPVLKLKFTPHFRMLFSNSKDPVLP